MSYFEQLVSVQDKVEFLGIIDNFYTESCLLQLMYDNKKYTVSEFTHLELQMSESPPQLLVSSAISNFIRQAWAYEHMCC